MKPMLLPFLSLLLLTGTSAARGGSPAVSSPETIFQRQTEGYHTFRIPSLTVTADGTLLAFAEGRRNSRSDTGDIDLVLRRSTDGGKSWGPLITVWDDGENVCGNPSAVVDRATGRIVLVTTWNLGSDHEKEINARTSKDTRRVFVLFSDDDGINWSSPREITASVKDPAWTWYATGPCHAVQLQKGKHKGRIVVPCDYGEFTGKGSVYHSLLIYSDDGGESWHTGARSPVGGNESTVAELSDGSVMLNMRGVRGPERERNGSCRSVAVSRDGGVTFGPVRHDTVLIEPVCQGSLLNYAPKGKPTRTLLFSNPASKSKRVDMTLRISRDNGRSWEQALKFDSRPAAYSDLTVLPGGDIGILYETGEASPYERIVFRTVPASVITGKTKLSAQ